MVLVVVRINEVPIEPDCLLEFTTAGHGNDRQATGTRRAAPPAREVQYAKILQRLTSGSSASCPVGRNRAGQSKQRKSRAPRTLSQRRAAGNCHFSAVPSSAISGTVSDH